MKLAKYFQSYEKLQSDSRYLYLVICGLTVALICTLYFACTKPVIVTIQPWTMTQDAQLSENKASRSYIEAWGMALSELIGNVTPSNVGYIAERISPLLAPEIYHSTMDALYANAESLRLDRTTLRFEPRVVTFEKSTGKVYVTGRSYRRLANSLEGEKNYNRTYEFRIRISHYAPLITHIDTYEGTPKTRDVLAREKVSKERALERERNQIKENVKWRKLEEADLMANGTDNTKL